MALIIGLTGGIGSGKSTVADYFEALNVTIADADIAARAVVTKGAPALNKIIQHFGKQILLSNGELDRKQLRQIIFQDAKERLWLESLLHPLIEDELKTTLRKSTSTYSILVSPLLLEAGQDKLVNRILLVDTPEDVQISRCLLRDRNTVEQVKAIMSTQSSRQERLAKADDILCNNVSLEKLREQVNALHQRYLLLATQP